MVRRWRLNIHLSFIPTGQDKEEPPTIALLERQSLMEFRRHCRDAGIAESKSSLELSVGVWVRDTLFPKKKFIVNMCEMRFGGKICKLAFKTFRVPTGTQEDWWNLFSKKIKRMLNQKRANVSSELKNLVVASWKEEVQRNDKNDEDMDEDANSLTGSGFGKTSWEDVIDLRKNTNAAYEEFCDLLLPSVVGKVKWKRNAHQKLLSQFITPTDEALCLLLLENNWDRWKDIAHGKTKDNLALTKFTADGKGSQAQEFKGWSDAGYERFNELCRNVIADRRSSVGVEFEKAYLKLKRDVFAGKRKVTKRGGTKNGSTIEIVDDLDDLDESDLLEDAEMDDDNDEEDEMESSEEIQNYMSRRVACSEPRVTGKLS